MKYIILFTAVVISFYSCSQPNHSQSTQNDNPTTNTNTHNLDSLINNKNYDELMHEGIEIYTKENDPLKAFPYFQTAWVKDSNRVEANYWLGYIYSNDFKNDTACSMSIKYYDKAIKIDDTYKKVFMQRAILKIKMNDLYGSLNDLNQAMVINTNDTDIYLYRALVKHKLKNENGACEDMLKAVNLGSTIAKKNYIAACVLHKE